MHICVHIAGGQRSVLSVFLSYPDTKLELPDLARLDGQPSQCCAPLHLVSLKINKHTHNFVCTCSHGEYKYLQRLQAPGAGVTVGYEPCDMGGAFCARASAL